LQPENGLACTAVADQQIAEMLPESSIENFVEPGTPVGTRMFPLDSSPIRWRTAYFGRLTVLLCNQRS
jgi:hypothetical protein